MTFTIRMPVQSDAAAIADLHVATWRETYSHLLPEGFFSDDYIAGRHRMWKRVLADRRDDMAVRVADCDGAIVGFAWVGPSLPLEGEVPPRERQLYAIYVLAAHHGTGIGQRLLDEVLGTGSALLWVATENPRAISFYERNRFRSDGVEQADPYVPAITEVRMTR